MEVKHPCTGEQPGEPAPIAFSLNSPDHVLEGTISVTLQVGDPDLVALEVHLAGKRLGSAALTEDGALDLALRLIGTIMSRRRAAQLTRTLSGGALLSNESRGLFRVVPMPPLD
jgi:hypothetical protein